MPACAVDEQDGRRSRPAVPVEVHAADTIAATARDAAQHDVGDCRACNAADVMRILDEADDVVREERSLALLQTPVHAAHSDRARVTVDAAGASEDRVVHDADAAWDALRSLATDDDRDACPIAGHLRVGTAKHVVDDRHPVHRADEVELRRAEPVDAETCSVRRAGGSPTRTTPGPGGRSGGGSCGKGARARTDSRAASGRSRSAHG